MAKKTEKPFLKIMNVASRLRLFVEFGDAALGEQTHQEFASEVLEAFEHLLMFRNIINSMASLDQAPTQAALMFLSDDEIEQARA